jgi:hypothetical protein
MKSRQLLPLLSILMACGAWARDPSFQSFGPPESGLIYYQKGVIPKEFNKPNTLVVLPQNPADVTGVQTDSGATISLAEAAKGGVMFAAYLDPIVRDCTLDATKTHCADNVITGGTYQQMMMGDAPECGAASGALTQWDNIVATSGGNNPPYGVAIDPRVSWYADKLVCVVKRIKADNPYIKAIFLDDYGPGYTPFVTADGGVYNKPGGYVCTALPVLGQAFDKLRAANLDLVYFVNATWHKNNASGCGGWPNAGLNGLAGALPVLEHHNFNDQGYAEDYMYVDANGVRSHQWLVDNGKNYTGALVITKGDSTMAPNQMTDTDYAKTRVWAGWIAQNNVTPGPAVGSPHWVGVTWGTKYGPGQHWDGVSSAGQDADRLRATPVTVSTGGTLKNATVYLDGMGGTSGIQSVKLALYKDNGSTTTPAPGALVAVGSEFYVSSQYPGAQWFVSDFPATSLAAGKYWLVEFTGGTAGIARSHGLTTVATDRWALSPYSSGAPANFPSPSNASSIQMDGFITVE